MENEKLEGFEGCGDGDNGDSDSNSGTELVILVGNSFIPPTEQLIKEFTASMLPEDMSVWQIV